MDLSYRGWYDVDWMQMVQDRDQWWSLLNTITKLQVP